MREYIRKLAPHPYSLILELFPQCTATAQDIVRLQHCLPETLPLTDNARSGITQLRNKQTIYPT